MKKITILLLIICIGLTTFTSCEERDVDGLIINDPNTEAIAEDIELASASIEAFIRRGKLKQRNNGYYKMVMYVPSDVANQVIATSLEVLTDVDATLEFSDDARNLPKVYEPQAFTLKKKGKTKDGAFVKFVNNQIRYKTDLSGLLLKTTATLKNEKGESISKPMTSYVTAIGLDAILDRNPKLKVKEKRLRANPSTRTAARRIKKQMISTLQTYTDSSEDDISDEEVAAYASELQVSMSLKPVDGGSEVEEGTFPLGFVEIRRGLVVFNNKKVNFSKLDNVKGKTYIATISVKSTDGKELDAATYRIVGE